MNVGARHHSGDRSNLAESPPGGRLWSLAILARARRSVLSPPVASATFFWTFQIVFCSVGVVNPHREDSIAYANDCLLLRSPSYST